MSVAAKPAEPAVAGRQRRTVTAWQHVRAVALLPFVNTVVIPAAILASTGGSGAADLGRPADAAVLAAGCALLLAGIALAAHSIRLFVRDGHGTLAPWDPTSALVTQGAYRYLRNPMKVGLFLILLAEAVLLRSLPLLGWFAAFAVANAVYIRVSEEQGLRKRFGLPYERYCARVPRWLPKLRLRRSRDLQRGAA
jgi:protein-S-isoprenylcysteine O-methyltransferase Ste14